VNLVWIAWEDDTSIRSRVLAEELGADYRAFTRFTQSKSFDWLRYPVATLQTVWTIMRMRPRVLFVQNPSILLAFEAALLKRIFGYQLVIDLHTPFIHPTGIRRAVATFLHEYGLRHCTAVIVTNDAYKKRVARQTQRPVFTLPDKIPELRDEFTPVPLRGKLNVLYICTFSIDEPWREVVAAGALLPDDTCIYISGRGPSEPQRLPGNVILTGYLPRKDYQNLLRSVDAVLVLTSADENLVCGGYEAVAAGKPIILSDTEALKGYFRDGTIFTANRSEAIAAAINRVREDTAALGQRISGLKRDLVAGWQLQWRNLLTHLDLARDVMALPRPGRTAAEKTSR
jgi:glycosyltransferase involved in cell wall biosynthesis